MARKAIPLVLDLETAANQLLSTVSFVRSEIRSGELKGIKLGNKLVVRAEELKEYLARKEAQGIPHPKPKPKKQKNSEVATKPAKDDTPSIFDSAAEGLPPSLPNEGSTEQSGPSDILGASIF